MSCIRHMFSRFGTPTETCIKCGVEHPDVTQWRRDQVALLQTSRPAGLAGQHPYIASGLMSRQQYLKSIRGRK